MTPPDDLARLGVVIVDHGSKREAANRLLEDVATAYKVFTGAAIVEPAHMELAEPTIGQAVDRCVAQGATEVAVALFFLSPGRHSTADIPALVSEASAQHPNIRIYITDPLGPDDALLDLLRRRVDEARRAGRMAS